MISQITVRLQFYKSISSIETVNNIEHLEIVKRPINENVLLRFNERVVNLIRITGQLSPNKVSCTLLLTVLITAYSTDKGPRRTDFGRF